MLIKLTHVEGRPVLLRSCDVKEVYEHEEFTSVYIIDGDDQNCLQVKETACTIMTLVNSDN